MIKKRFIDDGFEAIEDQSFTDTETDKTYYVDYFDEIIDLANGLNEKNKVLRKEIERLKIQNKDLLYSNAKNMELLEKENEQLKKQLKCNREEADDYCEELMGKDEFVRLYKRQRDDALKENRELKSDNDRLVNETAKIVAEHQSKVLDLIDEKIDELEGRYKFGQEVYKGCPMHNIRFGINVLKELKKELIE